MQYLQIRARLTTADAVQTQTASMLATVKEFASVNPALLETDITANVSITWAEFI